MELREQLEKSPIDKYSLGLRDRRKRWTRGNSYIERRLLEDLKLAVQ